MSSPHKQHPQQFDDFSDFLANTLRVGTKLRVYHISTPHVSIAPVYAAPPGEQGQATTCESHFLAVSQPIAKVTEDVSVQDPAFTQSDRKTKSDHVLVLGIEVLVFTTNVLTTVFVSKADSTGFVVRPANSSQGSSSIIKAVISAFLEWLVSRELSPKTLEPAGVTCQDLITTGSERHENSETHASNNAAEPKPTKARRKLVLSLFARSQNQYLFPGSVENTTKHVLDDRQLIRWWCRVLDGLVVKDWFMAAQANAEVGSEAAYPGNDSTSAHARHWVSTCGKYKVQAHVIVPGCDRSETTRSFFPPSAKHLPPNGTSQWHNSYPVELLVTQDRSATHNPLPVRCMIPRFPDDPKARYCEDLDSAGTDDKGQWRDIRTMQQFWETIEYRQECGAGRLVGFVWIVFDPTLFASNSVPDPEAIVGENHLKVTSGHAEHEVRLPEASNLTKDQSLQARIPANIMLSSKQYNELADHLINESDFAGLELALESTKDWIAKVIEMSGAPGFGVDIEGTVPSAIPFRSSVQSPETNVPHAAGQKRSVEDTGVVQINVLEGVKKKKRKVETDSENISPRLAGNGSQVDEDRAGSGRASTDQPKLDNANDVKILSAGLIRKKPKVQLC